MSIETFVVDLIEGRKNFPFLRGMLYALSLAYRFISAVRNFLYDQNFLKKNRSTVPVVSIGNLVAGGTGKTPFLQRVIQELSQNPGDIAVITRGYRSSSESKNILASLGAGPLVSADLCGDEPYWLALNTAASIYVGKDRIESLKKAEGVGSRIAFLEDGFQHRKVERNIDIVLLNADDLWGKGYFLPRGYLRESPKSLLRADWIVVTYLKPDVCREKILQQIRCFSNAPVVGIASIYCLNLDMKGKKVGAFCGIAKPQAFYEALKSQGVQVVKTLTFPDHRMASEKELSAFALECKLLEAEFLVCTEKDIVKLQAIASLALPIEVLKMKFECVWNENIWKEMVQSIQTRM